MLGNRKTFDGREHKAISAEEKSFSDSVLPVFDSIKESRTLEAGFEKVNRDLLGLIGADMLSIYCNDLNGKELRSFFRSGPIADLQSLSMKVPYSPATPAGYVALNKRSLFIPDISDTDKLLNIHSQLSIEEKDRQVQGKTIKSMIVVPIKDQAFLGVLQVVSFEGGSELTEETCKKAKLVSHILAKLLKSDLHKENLKGPFDKLVKMGKISNEQLIEVKKRAFDRNSTISRMLIEDYDISEDEIGFSMERFYGVPYKKFDSSIRLPSIFLEKIERKYLENNLWLPLSGDLEEVVVLIDDPSDQQRIFEIDKILNARSYIFKIGLPEHILKYLHALDDIHSESFENVFKVLEEKEKDKIVQFDPSLDDQKKLASSSAIIQLVKRIIIDSVNMGGSDIHIEPSKNSSKGIVRVRVDGDCKKIQDIPSAHMGALISRIKVMSSMDISERRLPQDGKCMETIGGRDVELRVTTYPTDGGESAVLRILTQESVTPLENLHLSDSNIQRIKQLTSKLHGMFLVVGPTGAGKTVTLHSILHHLNQEDIKIWTAEDPIEITQPGLQQMQMKPKIGLTFASAMRSFLRGDPDVILIGEMRDRETAGIAIEGSLTGHLVLSTLHSNSATETITRLLNLGMDPVNFSDALLGIMSQRLVKTLCPHCKESYVPDEKETDFLIEGYGADVFPELNIKREDIRLHRPVGCSKCEDTGYSGRVAIHELLAVSLEMQKMIYDQAPQIEIREQAIKDGMRTLKQDGIEKILQGLTDYRQLNRVVTD